MGVTLRRPMPVVAVPVWEDGPRASDRQPRRHHLARGLPGAGRRAPRGAGDPQGAGRQRDPAVGVPQAGRQPARHVPAGVGRERPVVVAVVVHRRRRAVGVDGARRRGGVAGRRRRRTRRSGGDPLQALHATLELLATEPLPGLPPLSGGMVGFFAYDLVRRLERLPELAVDDLELPDMLLLLATDIAAVDHHEGTITLIANAVNWNGTDERVDWAYDDAVARLDVMTAALGQPLPSTVATFSRPEPRHRSQRTRRGVRRDRRAPRRRDRGGRGVPGGAVAAVRDGHRRRPDRRVPDAAGVQPQPVHVSAAMCPNDAGGLDFSIVGSSPEALVTVKDGRATTHPIAGTRWRGDNRGRGPAAREGAAGRREGARRAPDAGRPGPQRPGPGLRAGHGAGRGLQPHRALQPRHAPGVDGDRACWPRAAPRWTR